MTANPALHKPVPPRPPEPKPRPTGNSGNETAQPTTRFERREHEPSDTRHEGELLEAHDERTERYRFLGRCRPATDAARSLARR